MDVIERKLDCIINLPLIPWYVTEVYISIRVGMRLFLGFGFRSRVTIAKRLVNTATESLSSSFIFIGYNCSVKTHVLIIYLVC